MFIIIIAIAGAIILLDFSVIGYLPKLLKIWYPLNEIIDDVLIEDTVYYSIRTNIPEPSGMPVITSRINYKSIILTSKDLIVRNTRLTYLFNIAIDSIIGYETDKKNMGWELKIYLTHKDAKRWISFRTKYVELWEEKLKNLEIRNLNEG